MCLGGPCRSLWGFGCSREAPQELCRRQQVGLALPEHGLKAPEVRVAGLPGTESRAPLRTGRLVWTDGGGYSSLRFYLISS